MNRSPFGHPLYRGGAFMDKEQSTDKQQLEKQRLQVQNQKTDNVFDNKNRIPNEQNAFKETQPRYGE